MAFDDKYEIVSQPSFDDRYEIVSEPSFNDRYEVVSQPQESSWGDVLSNTAQRGFAQFAGGMNNLGTATLDTISGITDSLPDWTTNMPIVGQSIRGMKASNPYIKDFAEQGDVTRTAINEGLEALRGQVNVREYSAKDLVGRGVEGVAPLLPQLAMAYASRNPSTLLTTLGMFSGAETQQEALDEGMGLLPATAKGGASGYLTSKIEKLPLGPDVLFSPVTGNIAKDAFNRLIWGPIKEGIEEPLENLGQRGIDMAFGDREAFSDLTAKELGDSALGGVLTGVGLSGGRYAGDKLGGSFATMAENKRQKELEADVDRWLADAETMEGQESSGDTGLIQPQFEETDTQQTRPDPGYDMGLGKPGWRLNKYELERAKADAEADTDSSQVEQDYEPPKVVSQTDNEVYVEVDPRDSEQTIEEMRSKGYEVYNTTPRPQPDGRSLPVTKAARHPVANIAVRPELFQMRENVSQTGTTPDRKIEGDYDESKFGELIVFRPKDPQDPRYQLEEGQDVITVDGHHRTDYVKNPETTDSLGNPIADVKVIELREEDGWTPELAEAYGAEQNIALGNVKQYDIANFYRKQKKANGRDWAEATAKRLGINKSRNGKTIGLNASDAVWHNLQKGKIDDSQALVIARELPDDTEQQREYLELALAGTSAKSIENKIIGSRVIPPPTIDGIDPQVWRDAAGNVIAREKKEASGSKNAYKHTQFSEYLAPEDQHIVTDKAKQRFAESNEQVKKLQKLKKGEQSGLAQEQLQEYNKKTEAEYERLMAQKAKEETQTGFNFSPETDSAPKRQKLSSDAGVGTIISDGIEGVADFLDQRFAGGKKQKAELGPFRTENTKTEKRLSRFGGRTSQFMTLPSTMADTTAQVPGSVERYKAGRQLTHDTAQHMSDFREPLRPFGKLSKKQRKPVESFLAAQRIAAADGKQLPETDDYLKRQGFDQEQIDAIRAVRHTLSEVAPEAFRAHKLQFAETDKQRQQINQMVDEWKKRPYVPFGRTGNWYVYVPKYDTKNQEDLSYFERFESQSEMVKRIKELQGQGFSKSSYRYGEMIKLDPSEGGINRVHLSAELDQMMEKFGLINERLDADGKPLPGGKLSADVNSFKKHLIPAKLTPGFDTDISSSIADYLSGLSHYMAHETYDHRDAQAKAKMPSNEVQLRRYWNRYHDYLKDPSSEDPLKLRQGMAYWYLTRPMSGIVNATQSVTTTMPLITEHVGVGKSYVEWAKAHKDIAKFAAGNQGFKNSELGKALTKYYEAENLADSAGNMFRSLKKGKKFQDDKKGVWKYANPMAFFQAAEDLNRGHAFIAGWNIASQKYNLKGQERIDFAQKFVDDTQFVYAKSNRPELARGPWLSTLMTFKLFFGNYLRFLRNRGVSPALGQALLHALLLGGKEALPFMKEGERILKALGWNTDKDIDEMIPKEMADRINMGMEGLGFEDFTGKVSDVVNRGIPATAGLVDLSGSLSAMELAATDQDNVFAAAGKAGLGVPGAFVHDLFAARELYEKGSYRQAVEKILPAAAKGPSKAQRWSSQGKFRANDNLPLPNTEDPTLTELIVTAIGGQAPRISKEYQKSHKEYVATTEAKDQKYVTRKMGDAIFELIETGDDSGLISVIEEIREHNQNAEPHQIITIDARDMPYIKDRLIKQMTDSNQGRQYYPKRAEGIINEIRSAP